MNKVARPMFKRKPKSTIYKPKPGDFKYWTRYVEYEKSYETRYKRHNPLLGTKWYGKKPWNYYINQFDPVTESGQSFNYKVMPLVEPVKDWHYFIGDRVEVLVGKDKGKIGEISHIIQERNWVVVTGLNLKKRKAYGTYLPEPYLVTSEVKLVDPSDMKQTEIEWRYTEYGDRVRVSSRTSRVIPIPRDTLWEDGVDSAKYKLSEKDTANSDLQEVTFIPENSTFEDDILKKFGLYTPRKNRKTYWY